VLIYWNFLTSLKGDEKRAMKEEGAMGTMRDMTWGWHRASGRPGDDFFEKLRKEDEMKAQDDAYKEGKVHGHWEEREGWVSTP